MKNNRLLTICSLFIGASLFSSCKDDSAPMVIPPDESGWMEVNGGGATYPNTAFIKLRSSEQTAVKRTDWDLAFYTGSDFKVLINGTTGAMASATGKTSLEEVGAEEISAAESSGELLLSFTNLEGILHVDDPSNPLENPIIAPISASDDENEVYLLNRGTSGATERTWKKIKITRADSGYLLEHADATGNSSSSLEIPKDDSYNFVYVSFEHGLVEVEPAKADWDIAWTAGTSSTPYPQASNGTLAYFFQDLVYHNIYGGTTTAEVLEEAIPYENFLHSDIASLDFNSDNRLTIGSSWRGGGGPNSSPAVLEDRYYIVKDSEDNYYKLRFLSLTKDGERGRPSFEYELVKEDV
ncbi:HmuY family protein [Algoriphagus halophilus]|uniref:HmuY protein n=1 Tax=Algoriphagus halophilus TaxID=226505 RepID=A0A1N6EAI7_9BACT|nr:HmuY family protein [Algoriphagus halophilus]SIN80050.1 HmuY protein [Algoriphagus halophilus]